MSLNELAAGKTPKLGLKNPFPKAKPKAAAGARKPPMNGKVPPAYGPK